MSTFKTQHPLGKFCEHMFFTASPNSTRVVSLPDAHHLHYARASTPPPRHRICHRHYINTLYIKTYAIAPTAHIPKRDDALPGFPKELVGNRAASRASFTTLHITFMLHARTHRNLVTHIVHTLL
jgi:hypothetical protein